MKTRQEFIVAHTGIAATKGLHYSASMDCRSLCFIALLAGAAHAAPVPVAPATNDVVSLHELAGRFGFPPPVETNATLTLKSAYSTLTFHADSRRLIYDGDLLWLNASASASNGLWTVASADDTAVISACLRASDVLRHQDATLVVLDPGHGGDDPGAGAGYGTPEKDIVLDIARRIAGTLRACGVAVRLTRDKDRTLTLDRRTQLARRWGADAFVSIHVNEAEREAASGIETYVMPCAGYPPTGSMRPDAAHYRGNLADAANTLLGLHIHRELRRRTQTPDRGLKRARFEVLRSAHCPATLVECGFLSNGGERARLATETYRHDIAQGIAQGLLAYLTKVEASQVLNRAR